MNANFLGFLISFLGATGSELERAPCIRADLDLARLELYCPPRFASEPPSRTTHRKTRAFARGALSFQAYGSNNFGDSGKGEMWSGHLGLGYYVADAVSINIDVFGAWVRSGIDDNGVAGGADAYGRWHFLVDDAEKWTVFIDLGAGLQQASTNYSGTHHFNFRLFSGVGGTLELTEGLHLLGGARYLHLSDAGAAGAGGGGFDGAFVFLGITIPF